ncbi:hypothetical protein Dimus_011021, partial [Dionaea muscipula]
MEAMTELDSGSNRPSRRRGGRENGGGARPGVLPSVKPSPTYRACTVCRRWKNTEGAAERCSPSPESSAVHRGGSRACTGGEKAEPCSPSMHHGGGEPRLVGDD